MVKLLINPRKTRILHHLTYTIDKLMHVVVTVNIDRSDQSFCSLACASPGLQAALNIPKSLILLHDGFMYRCTRQTTNHPRLHFATTIRPPSVLPLWMVNTLAGCRLQLQSSIGPNHVGCGELVTRDIANLWLVYAKSFSFFLLFFCLGLCYLVANTRTNTSYEW